MKSGDLIHIFRHSLLRKEPRAGHVGNESLLVGVPIHGVLLDRVVVNDYVFYGTLTEFGISYVRPQEFCLESELVTPTQA